MTDWLFSTATTVIAWWWSSELEANATPEKRGSEPALSEGSQVCPDSAGLVPSNRRTTPQSPFERKSARGYTLFGKTRYRCGSVAHRVRAPGNDKRSGRHDGYDQRFRRRSSVEPTRQRRTRHRDEPVAIGDDDVRRDRTVLVRVARARYVYRVGAGNGDA